MLKQLVKSDIFTIVDPSLRTTCLSLVSTLSALTPNFKSISAFFKKSSFLNLNLVASPTGKALVKRVLSYGIKSSAEIIVISPV